jgi:SAM-dependent methyltransferase
MESEVYTVALDVEADHWWFGARREILQRLVQNWAAPGSRVLDAGCMTGFVADVLETDYRVSLIDRAPEAVRACAQKGLPMVRGSLRELPYASESFDLVGCFDALYHRGMWPIGVPLREMWRVLRDEGVLLSVEPAYQWLFGDMDQLDHAKQRFTAASLARSLGEAGFLVERKGYFNTFLAPAIVALRLTRKLRRWLQPDLTPKQEVERPSRSVNALLTAIFRSEKALVARGGFPFGVSVVCVARRRRLQA